MPSLRNAGTPVFNTTGSLQPTVPGHQSGDILVLFQASSANASVTPTHSAPGDWTLIGSYANSTGTVRARISAYWKRTAGGESIPTVTQTPTGATACHHAAWINSYQNCIASGTPHEGQNGGATAGAAAQAVTRGATAANRLSVIAAHHADNVGTTWSENHADAYTQRQATDNATGIDGNSYCADFGPISDNGSVTMTVASGGTTVGIAGLAFALLPPASQNLNLTGSGNLTFSLLSDIDHDKNLSGGLTVETFQHQGPLAHDKNLVGALTALGWAHQGPLTRDVFLVGALTSQTWTPQGDPVVSESFKALSGALFTHTFTPQGALAHDKNLTGDTGLAFLLLSAISHDKNLVGALTVGTWAVIGNPSVPITHLAQGVLVVSAWFLEGHLTYRQLQSLWGPIAIASFMQAGGPAVQRNHNLLGEVGFAFKETGELSKDTRWKTYPFHSQLRG